MARLRTIKPAFFTNDELATVPPLGRLLFAGLWCVADREGRLEDRPLRIKAEVLPYDECDVHELLNQLARAGFVLRYEAEERRLIQIVNFAKHQNPHVKEAASTLPAPDEHSASTVLAQSYPRRISVSPYLGDLEPEAPSGAARKRAPRQHEPITDEFIAEMVTEFSRRLGGEQRVRDAIDKALNNKASDRWKDKRRGLRNWLKDDAARNLERTNGTTRSNLAKPAGSDGDERARALGRAHAARQLVQHVS